MTLNVIFTLTCFFLYPIYLYIDDIVLLYFKPNL